jgi:hypothetical protein
VAPGNVGLVLMAQLVPFQRSINVFVVAPTVYEPTAKHTVFVMQATAARSACDDPAGDGLATTDHAVPFQRSVSVFTCEAIVYEPTAMQYDAPVHEIASRLLVVAPAGLAVVVTTHALPFQRSPSGTPVNEAFNMPPIARQLVAAPHAIPLRKLSELPAGGAATDHAAPFQCSTRVAEPPEPTAVQSVAVAHAIPFRNPRTVGAATVVHALPSHCSTSDCGAELELPTAKQRIADEQATPRSPLDGRGGCACSDHIVPSQASANDPPFVRS